jgi:Starch-binding associating with outer membrane
MKIISIKYLTIAGLFALSIAGPGCAKIDDFGNINSDPSGITAPIPSALLTNVLSQMGGIASNTRTVTYCQYVSENQYTDVSLYALPQLEMGGTYSGPLNDMQVIISYNSDPKTAATASAYGSNANQIGIAKIIKAYLFWQTTDRWGDVPYSQALLGATNTSPKYDKQEDVYFGIIKEIKDAVAGFDAGATIKGDILYGGDIAKWKKFGNSLRMLMAMRLTKKYPNAGDKAAVQFADAIAANGGIISSNADNAVLKYPGGSFKNPWYLTYESRDDYAESKTMGDVLSGLGDTRQSVFGTNTTTFPYGLTRDLAVQFSNTVGNGQSRVLAASKRTESSPVTILGASTVLLAKAEAIERGWISVGTYGTAETAYNDGIAASFGEWGVTLPVSYLSGPANYNVGGGVATNIGGANAPFDNFRTASSNVQDAITSTKLQRIALQRWLAAYPNGNEGWAEFRRTGVPNLKTSRFSTGLYVNRYVYGVNDYSFNNEQTKAAAAAMPGGDKQESKVWWAQ